MSAQSDLDHTRGLLADVGFEFAGHVLPELIERGVREKASLSGFLDLVLSTEREAREERRVRTSLKLSGLSAAKTLESFDFTFARGVDRRKIELLATCEFARRRENVLLLGPPGVGKTHLALGLGVKAVANGFSVTSITADEMLTTVILDRLLHHCHVVQIDGRSFRLREVQAMAGDA